MTDQKKINELEEELARLDKEYGDLGAYKEYGQVIRTLIGIVKDSNNYTREQRNGIRNYAKEKREEIRAVIKMNHGSLEGKLNSLEKEVKQLAQQKKTESSAKFKEGFLGIRLGYDRTRGYSQLNDISVEISDGKKSFFLQTTNRKCNIHKDKTYKAYCEKKVAGGNYSVTVHLDGKKFTRQATVNGNCYLWFPLPLETKKPKDGKLFVQLGDCNYFYSGGPKDFDNQGVNIISKKDDKRIYLSTAETKWGDYSYPGSCKSELSGGNYIVQATVNGEKLTKNITVDGLTKIFLNFKKKKN